MDIRFDDVMDFVGMSILTCFIGALVIELLSKWTLVLATIIVGFFAVCLMVLVGGTVLILMGLVLEFVFWCVDFLQNHTQRFVR